MTCQQIESVAEELARAAEAGSVHVIVDGQAADAATVADRLADALRAIGQHCARLSDRSPLADEDAWRAEATPRMVVVADGPRWRASPPSGCWDVLVDPASGRAARPHLSAAGAAATTKPHGEVGGGTGA